jgi:hypothetical protein
MNNIFVKNNSRLFFLVSLFVMSANFSLNAASACVADNEYEIKNTNPFAGQFSSNQQMDLYFVEGDESCQYRYPRQHELFMHEIAKKFPYKLSSEYWNIDLCFANFIAAINEIVKNATLLRYVLDAKEKLLKNVKIPQGHYYCELESRDGKFQQISDECDKPDSPETMKLVFDVKLANEIIAYLKLVVGSLGVAFRGGNVKVENFGLFDLKSFKKATLISPQPYWFIDWFVTKHCGCAKNEFVCQILSESISNCCLLGVTCALQLLQNRGFDVASFLNSTVDGKIGDKTKLDELVLAKNDENRLKWGNKLGDFDTICEILMKYGALLHSDYIAMDNANILLLSCGYNSLR